MSQILNRFRPLFDPKAVAFVGATRDPSKWGFRIFHNIVLAGYTGRLYPINPREKELLGLTTYPSLLDTPEPVDLAIITVPPVVVPRVLRDCIAQHVPAAVLITAGYGETGAAGKQLEDEVVALARQGNILLVGPNTNGMQSATVNLRATMPPLAPRPGGVAIVSQSGNIGFSLMWRLVNAGIGMSRYVSSGNESALRCADYIEYYGEDPETRVILVYMEGVREGRRLLEVARRVNRRKPIVIAKSGHTDAGTKAARTHSSAMSGSDAVFDAVCREAGLIRVADIDEMFFVGAALATQPLPRGNRVAIVTTGGGWGVLAADACARAGLDVVELPAETIATIDTILPPWWSRANPVDLVAGMREGDLRRSVEAVLKSPNVDAVIMLGLGVGHMWGHAYSSSRFAEEYGLQAVAERAIAEDKRTVTDLRALRQEYGKPVISASDAGQIGRVPGGFLEMMAKHGDVPYATPREAALVLSSLAKYAAFRRSVTNEA